MLANARCVLFALLCGTILCAQAYAQEDVVIGTYEYTVEAGDTCNAIAKRVLGDIKYHETCVLRSPFTRQSEFGGLHLAFGW